MEFSLNLALRSKYEIQPVHFPGKQFTLHCTIAESFDIRYHDYLSNDTKHRSKYLTVQSQQHKD